MIYLASPYSHSDPLVREARFNAACLATAMHAVHSIAPVCAAEPGIRTFLDLPTAIDEK